tara:strand:- start:608 stop:862 length:255 start_codon:yes stop_codon:yes gene_type:complete
MRNFGEHRKTELEPFQVFSNIVSVLFLISIVFAGCFIYIKETAKTPHNTETIQKIVEQKLNISQIEISQDDRDWLTRTIEGETR